MLHQDSGAWIGAGKSTRADPVSMLAYRSRAVLPIDQRELDRILRRAQQRNRLEGLTGLLIFDEGYFFQWLEGPEPALMRVWQGIRSDRRHYDIEILREESLPERFFASWDMRLARRARKGIENALVGAKDPDEVVRKLRARPMVLGDGAWDRVFSDVVVPCLGFKYSVPLCDKRRLDLDLVPDMQSAGAIWHAARSAGAQLADALLAEDGAESALFVRALLHEGAGVEPLFREVFEPAARCLGGLCEQGRCSEFEVALAMGRLQLEVRRVSSVVRREDSMIKPGHAILVAPQPGEPHGLNATMCSELFWRDGWDVSCEFPNTDNALRGLVRDRWFDVLDLSLSGAQRRDQELQAMRVTIRAVQASSLNPSLAILVEGRSFFERPRAYQDVGADVGCVTAADAVLTAQRLLDALASHKKSQAFSVSFSPPGDMRSH